MKKFFIFILILIFIIFAFWFGYNLNNKEYIPPETVATTFFKRLSEGNYAEALKYYGGSFDTLATWNPGVSDNLELIRRGCEENGLNCLAVRNIIVDPSVSTEGLNEKGLYDRIIPFSVTFGKKDGGLFEIGPCCGEEDNGERFSEFTIFLAEKNGNYLVLTLPPYTP